MALEEKAQQLALSSKYKSEFLANMSHELRTPLNSLLILAKLLGDNKDGNLNQKQVEYAQTIYSSGTDLLNLINDVLDLSKVEAGKLDVHPIEVPIAEISEFVDRSFRPLAEEKGLSFKVDVMPDLPPAIVTDGHRLQQVLKNLLSNALKFTHNGGVTLTVRRAEKGRRFATRLAGRRPGRHRLRGERHRHRHSEGQAAAHLRGVPAGRRLDEPQVRRNRAWPFDLARDHAPVRRRDSRRERARQGQHLHAVPASQVRRRRARTKWQAAGAGAEQRESRGTRHE